MDLAAVVQEWNKRHLEIPRNEVSLFRLLSNILEELGPCTYVEELHGHKGSGKIRIKHMAWEGNPARNMRSSDTCHRSIQWRG